MFEIPRALQRQHEINDLVAHHGLTQVERYLEVHRTTIGRWCKGQIPVPIMAIVALRALKGDFPRFNPSAKAAWDGWRFEQDGNLYEPNGTPHTAIEISGIYWQTQLIASLNHRVKQLEAMLDKGNIQHRVVVTANDTFEDAANPMAKLLEENHQLKRKPRPRHR